MMHYDCKMSALILYIRDGHGLCCFAELSCGNFYLFIFLGGGGGGG